MWGLATPDALARRLGALFDELDDGRGEDRNAKQQRAMLMAIAKMQPATLGDIAKALDRGAPALSRAVDQAVQEGLVDRRQDPANRRRLQIRLTDYGRQVMDEGKTDCGPLAIRLSRLAQSEQRAVERAIEILERMP